MNVPRAATWLVLTGAGLWCAAYWPVRVYLAADALGAVNLALAICVAAALLALAPVALAAGKFPSHVPAAALAGVGIRLLLTATAGIVGYLTAHPSLVVYCGALVGAYSVLLAVETALVVKIVRASFARTTIEGGPA